MHQKIPAVLMAVGPKLPACHLALHCSMSPSLFGPRLALCSKLWSWSVHHLLSLLHLKLTAGVSVCMVKTSPIVWTVLISACALLRTRWIQLFFIIFCIWVLVDGPRQLHRQPGQAGAPAGRSFDATLVHLLPCRGRHNSPPSLAHDLWAGKQSQMRMGDHSACKAVTHWRR